MPCDRAAACAPCGMPLPSRLLPRRIGRTILACVVALGSLNTSRASDFATEMMEATFKLDDAGSHATVFLVRRDPRDAAIYLVPAAHVRGDNTAESVVIALRKANPDGSYERVNYNLRLRRDGRPLWVLGEEQD